MTEKSDILIYGEMAGGRLTTTTRELVSIGRRLSAELGHPLGILLVGAGLATAVAESATLVPGKIYVMDAAALADSDPERNVEAVIAACRRIAPQVILMGHTDVARDIAPRLAVRLEASIVTDCVDVTAEPDTGSLRQMRPVYGGKAMAVWLSEGDRPRIVTVRPRSAAPAEPDISNRGVVINLPADTINPTAKPKLVETVRDQGVSTRLEEAKVIVAGGAGIGGREGFDMVESLARLLGGVTGITRAVSDIGWMPSTLEIGQTGHIVKPDLYIAVGISGASQHLAGCQAAKYMVAINKDPEAYIFTVSDFGVVGDYREALPPLIEKLKALLAA